MPPVEIFRKGFAHLKLIIEHGIQRPTQFVDSIEGGLVQGRNDHRHTVRNLHGGFAFVMTLCNLAHAALDQFQAEGQHLVGMPRLEQCCKLLVNP